MRKHQAVLALAALVALSVAGAPAPAVAQPLDDATVRRETFETVWRIVDEKFYDPAFNGVDWKAVHDRYAPLVDAAKTDDELYTLLNKMLHELHASHFGVRAPEKNVDAAADPNDPAWAGSAGMTVRVVEGRPTVTEVDPQGGAAAAGVRPGFVLTRIGKRDLADVQKGVAGASLTPVMEHFMMRRVVETMLGGMPGKPVEVAYLDTADKAGTAEVVRKEPVGRPLKFGELPTILARVDARRLAGNVAYLRFNIFLPPMMDDIRAAVRSFKDAPAVIVDLRGNPGGVGAMAPAIAALFLTDESTLGTMKMRRGEIRFITYKQPDPYTGPLVILVDEGSASTSEIFAGSLQESGRAVVIGQRSLGAVLPSVIEKLPNGAIFQYAVADFKTPKGVLLEGRGVEPNVDVPLERASFLAGTDPALDAALRYLATRNAKGTTPR